jgi:hypothetical protein
MFLERVSIPPRFGNSRRQAVPIVTIVILPLVHVFRLCGRLFLAGAGLSGFCWLVAAPCAEFWF